MPTVEEEPIASTLTGRLSRTARLSVRSGRRNRSPTVRLERQSGDRVGGAAGRAKAGRAATAISCDNGRRRAKHHAAAKPKAHARKNIRVPQPNKPMPEI